MNWEQFKIQLAREAREYSADLRDLIESLRSKEGWIVLGLLLASMVVVGIFLFLALGFSPSPNEETVSFLYRAGLRPCREISNTTGLILFLNLFVLLFLVVMSLGNVFNMIDRIRSGRPREARELITTAVMMLVVGIGGIIHMSMIC